jgi:hypothetical protein
MVVLYLLISAIYAGVFIAYTHSHRDSVQLWETSYEYRYNRRKEDQQPIFTGEWTGFAIALLILGTLFWPLTVPAILVYRLTTKILNKNK